MFQLKFTIVANLEIIVSSNPNTKFGAPIYLASA